MYKTILTILLTLTILIPTTFAGISFKEEYGHQPITIIYFYKQECPACIKMSEFLKKINSTYKGGINIEQHEIKKNNSLQYAQTLANKQGFKIKTVPIIFIDDTFFNGFNNNIQNQLTNKINYCSQNTCIHPNNLETQQLENSNNQLITFLKILTTIILIITTIIITKKQKK